jgi:hypothetical protein
MNTKTKLFTVLPIALFITIASINIDKVEAKINVSPVVSAQKTITFDNKGDTKTQNLLSQINLFNSSLIEKNSSAKVLKDTSEKERLNNEIIQIARERQSMMSELMRTNPEIFNNLAISPSNRALFHKDAQNYIEK